MYNYRGDEYFYAGQLLGGIIGGMLIFFVIVLFIALIVAIIELIAQWKLYKKAGKGGWEAIVPFYNNWVLVEIAGLKWYWFLFFFAPLVLGLLNLGFLGYIAYLFAMFNIFYNLSKKFNKGIGFAICGALFPPICIMILGFSKKAIYNNDISVSENGVFEQSNNVDSKPETVTTTTKRETKNTQQKQSFCSNCGNKIKKEDKYCVHCGTKI